MQIYVHKNNQQLGPFTESEIRAQLAAGTISLQDHVWWQGQATWLPLGQTVLATSGAPGVTLVSPPPVATPGSVPAAHRVERTSGLAIGSLLSNLGCCVGSIVAIILGHMALSAIKKDPTLKGHGLALAGLIIGYLITLGMIAYLVVVSITMATMGDQVKEMFKTISSQLAAQQALNSPSSSDDSSTNSDSSTNAPDQSTNSAPVTPDSSTNAAPDNK